MDVYTQTLKNLPKELSNSIFKKLFELAKITNMNKKELDDFQQSLKNYRDMYLIENEWKKTLAEKDKIILTMGKDLATKEKALVTKEKALQAALARVAELERYPPRKYLQQRARGAVVRARD